MQVSREIQGKISYLYDSPGNTLKYGSTMPFGAFSAIYAEISCNRVGWNSPIFFGNEISVNFFSAFTILKFRTKYKNTVNCATITF